MSREELLEFIKSNLLLSNGFFDRYTTLRKSKKKGFEDFYNEIVSVTQFLGSTVWDKQFIQEIFIDDFKKEDSLYVPERFLEFTKKNLEKLISF